MIAKKSSKADLERKRFAFFQIGMIVAGSLTLAAFEYSSVQMEEKKVAIQDEGPVTYNFEPVFEDEVTEKPIPQTNREQASIQLNPIDEVTIVNKTINAKTIFTNQTIFVSEPCIDCEGIIWIEEPTEPIIDVPDKEPFFPGGEEAMAIFIKEHVDYPPMLVDMKVGGVAYVEFVVNTDGSICQVITKSDIHKDLKAEAERVVKLMPNWVPGEQAGKAVRVRYVIPINFQVK
jgi:protein TonB